MLRRVLMAMAMAGVLMLVPAPTEATVVLYDTFDTENGGVGVLNYAGFANWTVANGTVDLIGNGFFDFLPGNGLYVDLDGSTGDAGVVSGNFFGPGTYTLSFWLAGSQRGDSNTVTVGRTGTTIDTISLLSFVPFTPYSYTFTTAAPFQISFANSGGDNVGMLLDNVKLEAVPEPATLLLLGSGISALALRRRRKS